MKSVVCFTLLILCFLNLNTAFSADKTLSSFETDEQIRQWTPDMGVTLERSASFVTDGKKKWDGGAVEKVCHSREGGNPIHKV